MHVRPLLEEGKVYKVISPLYGIPEGKEIRFIYSDSELAEYSKNHKIPSHMYRWKGLGSLNKELTKEVLVNEDSRRLEQITIEDLEKTISTFDTLMGKNLVERKKMVMTGGDNEDNEEFD